MSKVLLKDLIYLYSGKYLRWNDPIKGLTSPNGEPVASSSGTEVTDFQFAKVMVLPENGASLSFRIWVQYTGLSQFYVVDGSDRSNITEAWTQEINIAGVERVYIEILSISTGSVNASIAQAESKETLVGIKRIGRWEEAGTGDQEGDILVYTASNGNRTLYEWDSSITQWQHRYTEGAYSDMPHLWTPDTYSTDSSLWLDLHEPSLVTESSGLISSVEGRAGLTYDQTEPSDQPSYPVDGPEALKPFGTFEADPLEVGDHTVYDNTAGATVFVLGKGSASSDHFISKYDYGADQREWYVKTDGTSFRENLTDASSSHEVNYPISTDWRIITVKWEPSVDLSVWLDGAFHNNAGVSIPSVTKGTAALAVGTQFNSGNYSDPLSGDIAEIVIIPAALSDADREKVEGYLAWKWNLQSKLDAGHTYKSDFPRI